MLSLLAAAVILEEGGADSYGEADEISAGDWSGTQYGPGMKELPGAVSKALRARFPRATIQVIMEVNKVKGKKETPLHYEVTLVTADKKTQEVIVSLDGKSLKREDEEKKGKKE